MLRVRIFCAILVLTVAWSSLALAADRAGYDRLVTDMDAARLAGADVFAPKTWEKAIKAWEKAKKDVANRKDQRTLDKHVAEAAEYTANAVKAAEVGALSLQEYLEPRNLAREAGADKLVPELYAEAEKVFLKAAKKVEEGKVKDALKEARKAKPLYAHAEMEAIRVEILGKSDMLIAKAEADEGEKHAPSTLDKARSARSKSNTILTSDRYNRSETLVLAAKAEYEARHASNIAKSVRSLERNDQAWEKLMLGYEIHMNRIGESFGLDHLSFDNGPAAATDELIGQITALQNHNNDLQAQLDGVAASLHQSLAQVSGVEPALAPMELAAQVEQGIIAVQMQQRTMEMKLETNQANLASLEQKQQAAESELATHREKEAKFRTAKSLLNPSEGEVLFNPANDVVLRLHGLSFKPGSSDIQDDHMALLAKVQKVLEMYPDAKIVIEGHTDALGDPASNVTLSQNRSYAVLKYLREAMLMPADKVQSMGYGADHPVASNRTPDGRAKNRRIDIVIMK